MKILVLADLHLDHWRSDRRGRDPLALLRPDLFGLDALILAGDLTNDPRRNWPDAFAALAKLIDPAKVHIFPGNHDYYRFRLDGDAELRRMVEAAGMNFAQKAVLTFGDLRLLCSTLWTDFNLLGAPVEAMQRAARTMNDYALIRRSTDSGPITPDDTALCHQDHLDWLTRAIREPWAGRTAIVTHHAPSAAALGSIDGLSPAFGSNLDAWIQHHRPDLWVFGHSHRPLDGWVGGTRLRNISMGYPFEVRPGEERRLIRRGLMDTEWAGLLVFDPEAEM